MTTTHGQKRTMYALDMVMDVVREIVAEQVLAERARCAAVAAAMADDAALACADAIERGAVTP